MYTSSPVFSRRCERRRRTELRGTAGNTWSKAERSIFTPPRHRARIIADASRASSSYSRVQWNLERLWRDVLFSDWSTKGDYV
jgi:hypothetical protein